MISRFQNLSKDFLQGCYCSLVPRSSNGFCRCFAFQIGKICYHHCIIRHFQFRKCLPVNSNTRFRVCTALYQICVTAWYKKLILIAAAIIIPLLWTGICLPLTYWFGFRSAQTMGLIVVIPMFYFVKYFEDGPGMAAMVNSVHSYVLITGIAAILIFGISLIISTIGYSRKN